MKPEGMTAERLALTEVAVECGKLIIAFREATSMRQEDLAQRLGVEQSTVSRWELGQRIPRDHWRKQIALALGDRNGVIFQRLRAAAS